MPCMAFSTIARTMVVIRRATASSSNSTTLLMLAIEGIAKSVIIKLIGKGPQGKAKDGK